MDAIVEAALRKWPNVPHCRGWLALDARGDWYMRDERVQQAGPFPAVKGSRIVHDKLVGFIARNYLADDDGAWFFQNGPQRVYVELEAAPWVWRLSGGDDGAAVTVASHTGLETTVTESVVDGSGRLFLATPIGLGLVHTLDMAVAAGCVEAGAWQPEEVPFAELPRRYRYQTSPATRHGASR